MLQPVQVIANRTQRLGGNVLELQRAHGLLHGNFDLLPAIRDPIDAIGEFVVDGLHLCDQIIGLHLGLGTGFQVT